MEENVHYHYYVIEFKTLPYENVDKYVYIPDSWIILRDISTQSVAFKYPIENKAITQDRVDAGESYSVNWTFFEATVIYATNSQRDAKNQIKTLNKQFVQEESSEKLTKEKKSSKSGNKTPNHSSTSEISKLKTSVPPLYCDAEFTATGDIASKQTPLAIPDKETCEKQDIPATCQDNIRRQARRLTQSSRLCNLEECCSVVNTHTRQKCNEKSNNGCSEKSASSRDSRNNVSNVNHNSMDSTNLNPKIIKPPIFGPKFSAQLKELDFYFEKIQLTFYRMSLAYKKKSLLVKEMIKQVEQFNNDNILYDPDTTSRNAVPTVVLERIDEVRNVVKGKTTKTRIQNCKETVREEKDDFDYNENEKDEDDNDNSDDDDSEDEVVPNKKRRQLLKFTLPPEYDKNDSKWTLRYREKRDELEELMPLTGIYVNSIRLKNCKRISKDAKTLARMVLVEIFTENALKTCSLTGRKCYASNKEGHGTRPGLDDDAITVLLNFVENYASKAMWEPIDIKIILRALRNKLRGLRIKYT